MSPHPRVSRSAAPRIEHAVALALAIGLALAAPADAEPLPGGSLDPTAIPKYEAPLVIPPVMPRTAKLPRRGGKNVDYYEIAVRQFEQ